MVNHASPCKPKHTAPVCYLPRHGHRSQHRRHAHYHGTCLKHSSMAPDGPACSCSEGSSLVARLVRMLRWRVEDMVLRMRVQAKQLEGLREGPKALWHVGHPPHCSP